MKPINVLQVLKESEKRYYYIDKFKNELNNKLKDAGYDVHISRNTDGVHEMVALKNGQGLGYALYELGNDTYDQGYDNLVIGGPLSVGEMLYDGKGTYDDYETLDPIMGKIATNGAKEYETNIADISVDDAFKIITEPFTKGDNTEVKSPKEQIIDYIKNEYGFDITHFDGKQNYGSEQANSLPDYIKDRLSIAKEIGLDVDTVVYGYPGSGDNYVSDSKSGIDISDDVNSEQPLLRKYINNFGDEIDIDKLNRIADKFIGNHDGLITDMGNIYADSSDGAWSIQGTVDGDVALYYLSKDYKKGFDMLKGLQESNLKEWSELYINEYKKFKHIDKVWDYLEGSKDESQLKSRMRDIDPSKFGSFTYELHNDKKGATVTNDDGNGDTEKVDIYFESAKLKESDEDDEYQAIYGEKTDWTEIKKLITALRSICNKSEEDGFNFCDKFKEAINKLSDVSEDLEEFYSGLHECNKLQEGRYTSDEEDNYPGLDKTIKVYDIDAFIDKEVNADSDEKYQPHTMDKAAIIVTKDGSGCILDYEAVGSSFDSVNDDIEIMLSKKDTTSDDGHMTVSIFPTAKIKAKVSEIMKDAPSQEMKVRDFFKKWNYNDRCASNFRGAKKYIDNME